MIENKNIELCEIKKLNFTSIGQVLTYEKLIIENYPVDNVKKIIICEEEDPELMSTLEKYGIGILKFPL